MKVKDAEVWQKWVESNQDAYGSAVIRYAERWADLMETRMAEGADLEAIAEETSREANTEGITGFMYGAAVSVLASSWEHGEDLRIWHNLKTQIQDEGERANATGGVLNPALIRME